MSFLLTAIDVDIEGGVAGGEASGLQRSDKRLICGSGFIFLKDVKVVEGIK
jgi:hypothetical protein